MTSIPPSQRAFYTVPPFVSREQELGVLEEVLAGLDRGGPAVVAVTGEAGIGKTRLLSTFRARMELRGVTVLSGRAAQYEQHVPFRLFGDAFAGAALPAHSAEAVAPLLGRTAQQPDPADALGRFSLFRATTATLDAVGGHRTAVLLDDVHWADPASLELIDHLVRHPATTGVMLVLALRGRQVPVPLAAVLAEGADRGTVLHLDVGPLDRDECIAGLAPFLDRRRSDEVYTASGGNPLYFLAMVHAARPDGAPAPPSGLTGLLLAELHPLTAPERRLLECCALLGELATDDLLGTVSGQGPDEVTAGLATLGQRDLVRQQAGSRGVTLRHPVLRALIYENTGPATRTLLHRRAAAALAQVGAPVAERANHVERGLSGVWNPDDAAVLAEAAELAASTAPVVAAHWLDVVLRLAPRDEHHAGTRHRLTLRRAQLLSLAGDLARSRDLLHDLIDAEPAGALRARAVALCALVERHLGHHAEASALVGRELARHRSEGRVAPALLGIELGTTALVAGRYPTARPVVAEALATARATGDRAGSAGVLALAAQGEVYEGETRAARAFADEAAAVADAATDAVFTDRCETFAQLASAEMLLDRFADAERHADRGLRIARGGGQLYVTPHLLVCKAYVCLLTGRVTRATELVGEAETVTRGLGSDPLLTFVLSFAALIAMHAGPPGDPGPVRIAEEAAALAATGEGWFPSLAWSMLGSVTAVTQPDRSRAAILRAGGPDLARLQPGIRPTFLELLTAAAIADGDLGEAAVWAARAGREAERIDLPTQRAAARRAEARLALATGDPDTAAERFLAAATECAGVGASLGEAAALLMCVQLAAGRPRRAGELWRRGHDIVVGSGSRLLQALADVVRPAADVAEKAAGRRLDTLTPREREVAQLIAAGLTSGAAAERLYLSRRTVEAHLSKIYRKLGVTSRAALATIVAQAAPPAAPAGAGS